MLLSISCKVKVVWSLDMDRSKNKMLEVTSHLLSPRCKAPFSVVKICKWWKNIYICNIWPCSSSSETYPHQIFNFQEMKTNDWSLPAFWTFKRGKQLTGHFHHFEFSREENKWLVTSNILKEQFIGHFWVAYVLSESISKFCKSPCKLC